MSKKILQRREAVSFLLVMAFFGVSALAACADGTAFKDDFREDRLGDVSHYVLFGNTAFDVEGGILRAALDYQGTATLNVLPAFGRDAAIALDFRRSGGGGSRFSVRANTRYGVTQSVLAYDVNVETGRVWEISTSVNGVDWLRKIDLTLDPARWHHLALRRSGEDFSLTIDGKSLFLSHSPPIDETWGIPGMNDYGGFSINIATSGGAMRFDPGAGRIRPYAPNAVEFDNLDVSGAAPRVNLVGLSSPFSLAGRPYLFSAIVEEEYRAWAEWSIPFAIQNTVDTYANVYRLLPDWENLGFVLCRGSYYYGGKKNNSRSGIVHQWVDPKRQDKISSHELAHNWSGLYAPTWAKEGMTYIAPLIMAEEVGKKAFTIDDLHETELSWDVARQQRFIVSELDSDDEFVYSKGATLCYLIYRLIGYQGWIDFHAEIDRRGRFLDGPSLFAALETTTGRSFSAITRGWTAGRGGAFDPAWVFLDSDGDGLRDLDDRLYGTNPADADSDADGLADKAEIAMGFDPRARDPGMERLLIPGRAGNDWTATGVQILSDPVGDGRTFDLKGVGVELDLDNGLVCIRLDFSGRPFAPDVLGDRQIYAQLYFGSNASETSHRVNLWAKAMGQRSWTAAFSYLPERKSLGDGDIAMYRGVDYMEASIPLSLLGSPETLFLRRVDGGITEIEDIMTSRNVELRPASGLPQLPAKPWIPTPLFPQ